MSEQWRMAFDKKSGDAYYVNDRGDKTFQRPIGFNPQRKVSGAALGTVRGFKRPSFFGGSTSGGAASKNLQRNLETPQSTGEESSASASRWFWQQQEKSKDSSRPGSRNTLRPSKGAPPASLHISEKVGTPLRVIFSYIARYEDELTLKPGQLVIGLERVEGGNWWYGESRGRRGHFPANFVKECREDEADALSLAKEPKLSRPSVTSFSSFFSSGGSQNQNHRAKRSDSILDGGRVKAIVDNYGASSSGWFQAPASAPPLPKKPESIANNQKLRGAAAQMKEKRKLQHVLGGVSTLRFTYWAHTWGYAFSLHAIVLGLIAIYWFDEAQDLSNSLRSRELLGAFFPWTGPVVAGSGLLSLLFESKLGLTRTEGQYQTFGGLPFRGMLYFLLSVPCFTGYCTLVAGIVGLGAAAVNYYSESQQERGTSPPKHYFPRISFEKMRNWSETEATIFLSFVLIMAVLFIYRFLVIEQVREGCVITAGADGCLTAWASIAKGFATMLNFSCACIVIPVLRAFIKYISTIEVSATKTLASAVPIKKAISLHKLIGYSVFIASAGHVIGHMLNFGASPSAVIKTFGELPLWTGGAVTIGMTIIFTAAHDSVRRSSFEAFWVSHQAFMVVFALLLCHAPKFWIAALLPLPAYAFDRLVRARRGTKAMLVDYVRFASPVLKLHFFPERMEDFVFREGQYLYIQVPYVSDYEWHPFTISSSFGDLQAEGYVSLHIRIQGPGSWTWQVKEYFQMLSGKGAALSEVRADGTAMDAQYESYLTHFDSAGVVQRGKRHGPDGKPLIRVDGPHAAPAQVYSVYRDVMLVGSGIGLTPSAAILSAVTRHKWKKGFQPETLRFFWVVRHSELSSFEWFIELLDDISRKVASDRKAGSITEYHRLEINIYVTQVPSSQNVIPLVTGTAVNKVKEHSEEEFRLREAGMLDKYLGFDVNSIRQLLNNPSVSSSEQAKVQFSQWGLDNKLPNRLGYLYVYNGRPDWEGIFAHVRDKRQRGVEEIGVCYCGAKLIAKDLKEKCKEYSAPGHMFRLEKEVF